MSDPKPKKATTPAIVIFDDTRSDLRDIETGVSNQLKENELDFEIIAIQDNWIDRARELLTLRDKMIWIIDVDTRNIPSENELDEHLSRLMEIDHHACFAYKRSNYPNMKHLGGLGMAVFAKEHSIPFRMMSNYDLSEDHLIPWIKEKEWDLSKEHYFDKDLLRKYELTELPDVKEEYKLLIEFIIQEMDIYPRTERISFVQMSDIHFRLQKNNKDEMVRDAIIIDIEKMMRDRKDMAITGLLINGDIAFSGKKKEYDLAIEWIEKIRGLLKIERNQVWIVPGNHDIERPVIEKDIVFKQLHEKIANVNSGVDLDLLLDECHASISAKKGLFKPLKNYLKFASQYNCIPVNNNICWESSELFGNGIEIKLHGINTCLFNAHIDDSKNLIVGLCQVPKLEKEDKNSIVVSLMHHPFDWLKDGEDTKNMLKERSKILLFGHKHNQVVDVIKDRLLVIASGAINPEPKEQHWESVYNWIQLRCFKKHDVDWLEIDLFPRRFIRAGLKKQFMFGEYAEFCDEGSKSSKHYIKINQ